MTSRILATFSLVGLGALTSFASAAPTASPTSPAAATCPKLTAAQCEADPRWSTVGYCATTPAAPAGMSACAGAQKTAALDKCALAQAADCKETIKAAQKKDTARAAAPKIKVLDPDGKNIPADLKDGHRRGSYGKPKKGRELKVVGKNVIARSGLTNAPAYSQKSAKAATAHRKPEWDKNGEKIKSCQEYAYEKLYDGMRYIDAVGACAGDRACEVEVAYMDKTPGIARRTLKRKDGAPIKPQLKLRDSGKLAKNDLFLAPSDFAYAIDPVVDGNYEINTLTGARSWKTTPEMEELAKLLDKGRHWYSFGCTTDCGPRKFKNEWGFHDKLRASNKLSDAEFAEYERRKAEYRALHEIWVAAASEAEVRRREAQKQLNDRINKPRVSRVSRLDAQSSDPFERQQLMTEGIEAVQANQTKAGTPKVGLPNAGRQAHARRGGTSAIGVLAAPVPSKAKPGVKAGVKPGIKAKHCSPSHWADRDANMDDLFYGGPASCAIADFLKEEYKRKAAGQKSCLDLDDDDCDWSPETFHGRFVASFPYGEELQAHEDYCQRWTGGTMTADNLDEADAYIEKMKKLIADAAKKLGPYNEKNDVELKGRKMWRIGSDWADAQSFGDQDWFAAGYDYDVGWHIHPVAVAKDQKICALTGKSHGNFGIDAWLLGASVDVVDATSHFRTNESNNGTTHFDASVKVLGDDLFPAIDQDFTTAWAPEDPLGGSQDLPPGWKPSITIMAGPVPVTGSAWGSIFYDAVVSADAKVAKTKGACDPKNVQFKIHGMVEPELGVAGYAEIGAGISGLLSAGIRGSLTLVSLGLPLNAKLQVTNKKIDEHNKQPTATFTTSLDLAVSTLSGYISLYVEILFFEDEWELFSWSGVSDEVTLMDPPLEADMPLLGWPG